MKPLNLVGTRKPTRERDPSHQKRWEKKIIDFLKNATAVQTGWDDMSLCSLEGMAGKGGFSLCESLALLGETEIKEPWTLRFFADDVSLGGSQYWDCINAFGLANLFVTQRSQWGEIACSTLYNPGWSLVHNTAETNVTLVYFSQKGWLALVRRKWLMENNRLLLDYMSKYMHLDYI